MKKFIPFSILMFFFCLFNLHAQQQYKVSVKGYIRSKDKNLECHTHVKMTYYYSSGNSKYEEILMAGSGNHNAGRPWTFSKEFVTNERITSIKCVGVHADNPSGPKSCYTVSEGSDSRTISASDYPCINIRLNNKIIGNYDDGSYVTVSIEPVNITISYHNEVQYGNNDAPGINFLHENIPITIKATKGFPSNVYKWEYSIGNSYNWTSLNDTYMNYDRSEITLKATDLLSYEQIMYKTPVYIRINCNCENFKTSNRIDLQPKIAAPVFKRVIEKKAENCPGNADGEITIEFNRNLFPGETVEILGKDENSGFYISLEQEMIEGNRIRIYNLSPGSYTFQLKGSYIDHHGDRISTGIIADGDGYSLVENIVTGTSPAFELIDFRGVTCPDGNDGWIKALGEGGSGCYKLVCENQRGEIFESGFSDSEIYISDLPIERYNVWIVDSKGCPADMLRDRIAINPPENPIEIDKTSLFNPMEGENTGSISISVKNGTPPYEAIWRKENKSGEILNTNIQSGGNNNEISTISNLWKGNYYVGFTDANGCKTGETIQLEAFPVFDITITQTANIHCYGENSGELSIVVNSGGSGTYNKYEWYMVDEYLSYHPIGGNSTTLSNIPGGNYRVKVTDSEGRQSWSNITVINQPVPIEVSFDSGFLQCRGNGDGQITATISCGAGNYSWSWENGESGAGSTAILENLTAGSYSIEVTDGNNCRGIFYGFVNEPDPLSVSERIIPPSCSGMGNGKIELYISGGTPEYNILWSNGQTTSNIQNLTTGNYSVVVIDRYGCETIEKDFYLAEPEILNVSINRLTNISENGKKDGSIQIAMEGGSAPYRISCNDDKNNVYAIPGINYPPGQPANVEIKNLPEGNYTLFVQDRFYQSNPDNGYGSCSYTLQFSINEPPPFYISIEQMHPVTCNNGNDGILTVHAEGGIPFETGNPYLYKWYRMQGTSRIFIEDSGNKTGLEGLEPGIYLVEATDMNHVSTFSAPFTLTNPTVIKMEFQTAVLTCASDSSGWVEASVSGGEGVFLYEWSTGESGTNRIDRKPGGWYFLSVTDERGCEATDSAFISSPLSIQIGYESAPPLCDGHGDAYISMIISGGEAPYYYKWSTGDTTAYLDNVYPGQYQVRITDDLGCYRDTTFFIPGVTPVTINPEEIVQPKAFGYSDGSIRVRLSGGAPPYSISWKNDRDELIPSENTEEDGIVISAIKSIPKGIYNLFVEDNNYQHVEQPSPFDSCGCLFNQTFYVSEPPILELEVKKTRIIRCSGSNDGAFSAYVQGGVPHENGSPYTYEWFRNGSLTGKNDSILSGLGKGYYHVRITDANGISIESEKIFLDEPEKLSVATSAADLRCSLDTDGWIQADVSGGTAPYNFSWSNGENTSRMENIPKGKYFVFITDANGCETTGTATIAQSKGITAKAELTLPTCHNGSDGIIRVSVSGGEPPYSYEWNDGRKSLIHDRLPSGNYSITITDNNRCSYEIFTYTLSQPDSIIIDLGKDITLCDKQSLKVIAESTETITNYVWFNQSGVKLSDKQDITLLDPGVYRVEVLTGKGCKGEGSIRINREDMEIANDFLAASQVPINDEVFVVNISNPSPDRIEWILPDGEGTNFDVINKNENILSLIFKQYGTFSIGMITYLGDCTETVYKTVQVMDKENIANYEEADEPVLKSFFVYPNPNPGYFEASIEVKDEHPIVLQLVNSGSGKVIERKTLKGKRIYKESFNITGNEKGTYILNLYTLQNKSVKKVIIN